MSLIILPDDPEFYATLAVAKRPDWHDVAAVGGDGCNFVIDSSGIARPVSARELDEYLLGGEYDEVIGEDEEYD